jgi:hypothetical protein
MGTKLRELAIVCAAALPGMLLALAAKPLILGERALFGGMALAFVGPIIAFAVLRVKPRS